MPLEWLCWALIFLMFMHICLWQCLSLLQNKLPWHQTESIVLSTWLEQRYGKQMQQKNLELFPRTDWQDLSYSHEMSSVDSFSRNKFQKLSIERNRVEEKRADWGRNVMDLTFCIFFTDWVKVFYCIVMYTKALLEELHSDLPVELKQTDMYHRNTSVF